MCRLITEPQKCCIYITRQVFKIIEINVNISFPEAIAAQIRSSNCCWKNEAIKKIRYLPSGLNCTQNTDFNRLKTWYLQKNTILMWSKNKTHTHTKVIAFVLCKRHWGENANESLSLSELFKNPWLWCLQCKLYF